MTQHPIQPLEKDKEGVLRFKKNRIVTFLLDAGPFDLNKIAMKGFPDEDHEQLAQLIGYSLGGFSELSYVSDETYEKAEMEGAIDTLTAVMKESLSDDRIAQIIRNPRDPVPDDEWEALDEMIRELNEKVVRLKGEKYKKLRIDVLARDDFKCRVCGRYTLAPPHHIVFRSQGGPDTMENMVTICGPLEEDCHDGFHRGCKYKGKLVDGEFVYWEI